MPTLQVLLDDGTGTFPFDITADVSLRQPLVTKVGREDELADFSAGSLELWLRNDDGDYSFGSAAYDCRPDQRVRLVRTRGGSTERFTGYVDAWPTTWEGALGTKAWAHVTVMDLQARLNRDELPSLLEAEARVNGADGYYPLTEPEGSTSAGSVLGGRPAVSVAGTGADIAFAAADGPTWLDGSVPTFTAGGKVLSGEVAVGNGVSRSIAGFVSTTTVTDTALAQVGQEKSLDDGHVRSLSFGISSSGKATATASTRLSIIKATSTTSINDGATHHVSATLTVSGTLVTVRVWVDGVMEASATDVMSPDQAATSGLMLTVGAQGSSGTVAISHIVLGPASIDQADVHAAGLTGFAGESAATRLGRLASYGGATATSTADTVMAGQDIAGSTVWAAMSAVADAEGGRLFANGWGQAQLTDRDDDWLKATGPAAVTLPVSAIEHDDLEVLGDTQFVYNVATGTRTGGAEQTYTNTTSRAKYGVHKLELGTLLVQTDAEVLSRLAWFVKSYGEVGPRMSTVTVSLLHASDSTVAAVLDAGIGSRLRVVSMPSQSPTSAVDLIVEGWTDTLSTGEWTRTFNTSPAATQQPWILGDATFGVLGVTTRPAY